MTFPFRSLRRLCWLAAAVVTASCSGPTNPLNLIPPDTGGIHAALAAGSDPGRPYGTWVYVPGGASRSRVPYPILIFLHGSGERGSNLDQVLTHGPPKLIARGEWSPPVPMIVVSPQCPAGSNWNAGSIDALISWALKEFPADSKRIYVTGLSMGGYGTWNWAMSSNRAHTPAAIVPICGAGGTSGAPRLAGTPVWAFHGDADGTVGVSGSVDIVKAIAAAGTSAPLRLTVYSGVGHDSWTRTYEPYGSRSGLGQGVANHAPDTAVNPWLVRYAPDIYEWMLRFQAP